MHALITIPAAHQAAANALAKQHFAETEGQDVFVIPLYDAATQVDGAPIAYAASPEFTSEAALAMAHTLVVGIPGATIDTYEIGQPFNLVTTLQGHGLRLFIPPAP